MRGRRVPAAAQWHARAAAAAPCRLPPRHSHYCGALVAFKGGGLPRTADTVHLQRRLFWVSSPALAWRPCSPTGGSGSSSDTNTTSPEKVVSSESAAKRSRKHEPSPEELLVRRVSTLVGQRDAAAAVQAVKAALKGSVDATARVPAATTAATDAAEGAGPPPAPTSSTPAARRPPVFSTKAFAAALFACEATGDAAAGLSLVDEVRRSASAGVSAEWLSTEHVLSVVLRLQCAAGDGDGAQHMFAYLDQHKLLRLRSAAAYLQFCCNQLQSRDLAMAVYEAALRHKIELTEPDYLALGRVCVRVREPFRTLLYMLQEMREHVAEVSEAMARDVLEPWVRLAREDTRVSAVGGGAVAQVQLQWVDEMRLDCATAHAPPSSPPSHASVDSRASPADVVVRQRGVCPACTTELAGYPFTAACRTHLLRELTEIVIPRACRSSRAKMGFEHWKRYIHARRDAGDRVDTFIDGANLGYYGLSSWYDLAKRALLLHRGVPESRITAHELDFNAQCKAAGHGVDVGANFQLIDSAVRLATETYGLHKPLVMLHERHVEPKFMTSESEAIVQRWRARGWLYCSPTGLNDDLCWLYGALLLTDPTDTVQGSTAASASAPPHRTLVCTNDKMRDHHFRLLSPRAFTRWRDRHRIAFRCARVEDRTELHWTLPAPFERCIQRHDTQAATPAQTAAITTAWHIPISMTGAPTAEGLSPRADGEADSAETDGADPMSEMHAAELTPVRPGPWICLTVRRVTA